MKKRIGYILLIILLPAARLSGQQLPHYTQFMFNEYVINPAVAGTKDYYQVRSNSRFQWAGIIDAPQTISLSIFGPHKTRPMGLGGYLFNDVTGPVSRTGVYGSYAYNIEPWNDIRLSMGLSLGILQNKIDGTEIRMFEDDPVFKGGVYSAYSPDASVGVYLYASNWFAGLSAFQLFANSLKVYDEKSGLNRLKNHFYLYGGYQYELNDEFRIEPSLIIKGMSPVPMQIDLNIRATYRNMVWLGTSVRSQDAVAILIGYIHEENLYFGYSYDFSISDIKKFNSGSHEILIGARFKPIK